MNIYKYIWIRLSVNNSFMVNNEIFNINDIEYIFNKYSHYYICSLIKLRFIYLHNFAFIYKIDNIKEINIYI